jgi:rod shape determining protein RodA
MNINRRFLLGFDWLWLLAMIALAGAGSIAIWSATGGSGINSYFGRQILFLMAGFLLALILLYFDYHVYADFIKLAYLAGLLILVVTLLMGHTVHGSKSWLYLGTIGFQPSEFMKVLIIVALAKYYSETERDYLEFQELLAGGLIVLVPMLLVVLQGDLGTAATYLPIFIVLSYLAGVRRKHILVLFLAGAVAAPLFWMNLRDYQKGRIQSVFDPSSDPRNTGYQAIQSKIAIGSGRFLGKGFQQGTQSQLGFVPARHTDFVFAVISEERGFVGSFTVLALFFFISLRLLRAGREAKDKIGTMIVAGVLGLFLFHIFINVGMVMGLLPIAGIPLPFVSAGGSALISFFIAMSLCMNVRMRRYIN